MRLDLLTLFPEMFAGVLGSSILKRAAEPLKDPATGNVRPPVVEYHLANLRDHTTNKHQKVDQPPYGGGPGMVIQSQVVWDAVHAVEAQDPRPATRVVMTPQGKPLTHAIVEQLARKPRLMLIAGHYEGFDERVLDALRDEPAGLEEISIGDYVLSGGELPAMVLLDAVVRLIPGALGTQASAHDESFSSELGGLLDYPHYTRPRTWQGRDVPDVLLSGDHAKINAWRLEQARQRTADRRPDLLGQPAAIGRSTITVLRTEQPSDIDAVDRVLREAFPTDAEAKLVRALRDQREAVTSLVAEVDSEVVGHVMLSPVTFADQPSVRGMVGLAPVAVRPTWQGRGIGAALVRQALAEAKQLASRAVVVLGEPTYYQRFGFEPASPLGLTSDYGSGPEFMIALLRGPLPATWQGHIQYAKSFQSL
ncbi:tRNA (guanosine(37)-N1)-methyltransferase TrmD [Phycisphaerales bacterium AB-hyl4]|uniref:tRNA (guanine-N(1)-)-methyltransferase n=1 Tax=Natronomicrosphaera hydrolytica TaxID=3242702 RepID=A0ABV4U1T2_9BACT